jgi:hypothetical protein
MQHHHTPKPLRSPWGTPIDAREIAAGIWELITRGGGGYLLSQSRLDAMPAALSQVHISSPPNGFEQDTYFSLAVLSFPREFRTYYAQQEVVRGQAFLPHLRMATRIALAWFHVYPGFVDWVKAQPIYEDVLSWEHDHQHDWEVIGYVSGDFSTWTIFLRRIADGARKEISANNRWTGYLTDHQLQHIQSSFTPSYPHTMPLSYRLPIGGRMLYPG